MVAKKSDLPLSVNDNGEGCSDREKLQALDKNTLLFLSNVDDITLLVDRELKIVTFSKNFKDQYKMLVGGEVSKGDSILSFSFKTDKNILADIYAKVFTGETIY